jgi:hypothetical protein
VGSRTRRAFGLGFSLILFAEEDGATEVAEFYLIHVRHDDISDAEEGKVLDDFVTQGACADDENARVTQRILVPPFNGFQPCETAFMEADGCWRDCGHKLIQFNRR